MIWLENFLKRLDWSTWIIIFITQQDFVLINHAISLVEEFSCTLTIISLKIRKSMKQFLYDNAKFPHDFLVAVCHTSFWPTPSQRKGSSKLGTRYFLSKYERGTCTVLPLICTASNQINKFHRLKIYEGNLWRKFTRLFTLRTSLPAFLHVENEIRALHNCVL